MHPVQSLDLVAQNDSWSKPWLKANKGERKGEKGGEKKAERFRKTVALNPVDWVSRS